MPRIAMGLEYDGSDYAGWQVQPDQVTVQGKVEEALSRVADAPVQVCCAGRTDAGVHATGQVVHFDSDAPRSEWAWVMGANANLPRSISATWAQTVPDEFHARFLAVSRTYRYLLLNRPTRPGLDHHRVAWSHRALDAARMQDAACELVGEHDFSAFRAQACQAKTPVRTIHRFDVHRQDDTIVFEVCANAFLYHMVRNMVGSLMRIGAGEAGRDWLAGVLAGRDRSAAAATASPAGLYLVAVEYPRSYGLPGAAVSCEVE
jgi:tRNA pseudouridine38-40 synthase